MSEAATSISKIQSETGDRLYTIQEIPGKGHGMLAAKKLMKGTRILAESPLFRVPRRGTSKKLMHDNNARKIAALGEKQRQAFFSLQNSFEDEGPEVGRIQTNALPLGSNATTGGIFLDASRINHSCNANSQNTWNENLQKLTIHASRDIPEGDDITITYFASRRNRSARQDELWTKFRFNCSCSLCSLPFDQQKVSDERLNEIDTLDRLIGDGMGIISAPLQTLHSVQRLLTLLDEEGFADDASAPRAYYDAFQIAITHGDIARAIVFAERATSGRVILEGSDSPEVQRLERFAKNPSQHMAYGMSNKWRTVRDDIPKDLDKDDFERWLWRKETAVVSQYADLRSETAFPTFDNLPDDNGVNLVYYRSVDGFSFRPRRHWCFLAEIIEIEAFLRLRLIVNDKAGQEIPVAFYTDDRGGELNPSYIQEGYTVAILYAEQHGFLDLTTGIRHENTATINIFPFSLQTLLTLSDKIQQYATELEGMRTCHGCNRKAVSLQKCLRCNLFWYCNKSCQIAGWNEKGHKADCKSLKNPDLRRLFLMEWDSFEDYYTFG